MLYDSNIIICQTEDGRYRAAPPFRCQRARSITSPRVTHGSSPVALPEEPEEELFSDMKEKKPERGTQDVSDTRLFPDIPVFDREEVMERVCDDETLCRKVLEIFSRDMPGKMEALKAAWNHGDGEAVSLQAHSVKGMAANVSGRRLSALALETEKAGNRKDMEMAGLLIADMEKAYDALLSAFDEAGLRGKTANRQQG